MFVLVSCVTVSRPVYHADSRFTIHDFVILFARSQLTITNQDLVTKTQDSY